jgi:hypothetical protein
MIMHQSTPESRSIIVLREENPLEKVPGIRPPHYLLSRILAKIDEAIRLRARMRIALATVLGTSSVIAAVPALQFASQEFSRSGFTNFISLILSDGFRLAPYWKDMALTIAGSLPILGVAAVAFVLLAAICSLSLASTYYKSAFA